MKYGILFVTGIMFFLYSPVQAQNNNNNVVVVSYFKCQYDKLGEVNQMMKQENAPILDEMADAGQLLDWGAMTHSWGDEWNYVVYYVAEDLGTFEEAFGEYYAQVLEANPKGLEEFSALCPEHKDNIYHHVMGYQEGDGNSGSMQEQ